MHKHKVEDSKKRSFLKALTGYLSEVLIDSFLISSILKIIGVETSSAISIGFGISLLTEFICFLVHYGNDRVWNRIQFGRKVTDLKETHKIYWSCHDCLWRAYPGSFMICEHPITREKMKKHDTLCKTPCEYFEPDRTGKECYVRKEKGYSWVKTTVPEYLEEESN